MKKVVLALCFCIASVIPAAAQGPYVGLSGGVSLLHESDLDVGGGSGTIEYDTGFGFNVAAGYVMNPVRVEAEFGYKAADLDSVSGPGGSIGISGADLTVMSYMLNGYYDMKVDPTITPFVGFGIGVIDGELEGSGGSIDDAVFGYQATLGVSAAMNRNLNLDVYYRYQGSEDLEEDGFELSYDSSNIFVGVRYSF